jgi:hypothetical protein
VAGPRVILAEPVPLCPNCRKGQANDLGVKAEEVVSSQVVATVDVVRSDVIVWWTNVRPERTSSMARNCGAWSLPKNDVESLQVLLSNKVCLPTPTGRRHLDSVSPGRQVLLDPGATLAFVLGEQLRLSTILATARSKSSAKELRWPKSPSPLNLVSVKQQTAPKPMQRALGIANWLVELSEFWDSIEAARLSRPVLRKQDGPLVRNLPIVFEGQGIEQPLTLALDL